MFSKQELQVIGQTLNQRREWLQKQLEKPELEAQKLQNARTLQLIESTLAKIGAALRTGNTQAATAPAAKETVNHYISTRSLSPTKQAAIDHRINLDAEDIRVLVVDDDQLICDLLGVLLRSAGIAQIDTASDGMKGINMMFNANPIYDLILCDWNMPSKSGIDVHNAMRAAERYHHAIFMLVTAVSEAAQIRSAIEEGVDDYVVKPIEKDKLLKKLNRFFPKIQISAAE